MSIQGNNGDAIGMDRELVGDLVAAAIRREINGQIRDLEKAVIGLTHEHRQTRDDVVEIKSTLTQGIERWDAASDVTERITDFARLATSRGAKIAVVGIAALIGADAVARIVFG